jgi:putative glutamine amidotransferase
MAASARFPGGGAGLPLIAVTTPEMRAPMLDGATAEADPPRTEMVLGMRYLEAIGRAGGLAMVVPPLPGPAIPALLDRVDGICLSGGPDLHPDAYGADPHPELGPTEPRLDAFELALARAADERDMPVLAICRGAQVLNVARGGTLHQHLPDRTDLEHRQGEAPFEPVHRVSLAAKSLLYRLAGSAWLAVNSFHHQAADRIGDGLRVCATAPDGTVEALWDPGARFCVGVQWHPEVLTHRSEHAALFHGLVAAAAGSAAPSLALVA